MKTKHNNGMLAMVCVIGIFIATILVGVTVGVSAESVVRRTSQLVGAVEIPHLGVAEIPHRIHVVSNRTWKIASLDEVFGIAETERSVQVATDTASAPTTASAKTNETPRHVVTYTYTDTSVNQYQGLGVAFIQHHVDPTTRNRSWRMPSL